MLSDDDIKTLAHKIRESRKTIVEALSEAYDKSDSHELTEYCENVNCRDCPISLELQKLKRIGCWTTDEEVINLATKR